MEPGRQTQPQEPTEDEETAHDLEEGLCCATTWPSPIH